jgi:hypothetical protein
MANLRGFFHVGLNSGQRDSSPCFYRSGEFSRTGISLPYSRHRTAARRQSERSRCNPSNARTEAGSTPKNFCFGANETAHGAWRVAAKGTLLPCGLSGGGGAVGPPTSGPMTRGTPASFNLQIGYDTRIPKKVTGPAWPSGRLTKMTISLSAAPLSEEVASMVQARVTTL